MIIKKFRIIIIFLALSLVSLITIQLYWIRQAIQLREEQFNNHVNATLKDIAGRIESNMTCFELFGRVHINAGEGIYMAKQPWQLDEKGNERFKTPVIGENFIMNLDTVPYFYNYPPANDTLYSFKSLKFDYAADAEIIVRFSLKFNDTLKNQGVLIDSGGINMLTASEFRHASMLQDPIAGKLDTLLLDSLLHTSFSDIGIKQHFNYALVSHDDKPVYSNMAMIGNELLESPLKAFIYNNNYFSQPYRILVHFENQRTLVWQSMWLLLSASAAVILLLIIAFWLAVHFIMKQKKLSEMKADFINNLTHEFKTPVSVISLAAETMMSPVILNDPQRLVRFIDVLKNEGRKLGDQVERILQVSTLEKKQVTMQDQSIDIHEQINKAVKTFALITEQKNASVSLSLEAEKSLIVGDEMHLFNMISNLIDNALKYTNGRKSEIYISTANRNGSFLLEIKDNGIGIAKEDIQKIFRKFYRIPTGDIHKTKGFGIGLSYVNYIVEAHGGTITVKSEINKGSHFTVSIPLNQKE